MKLVKGNLVNIKQLKNFCENTPLVVHSAMFENKWLMARGIDPYIIDDTLMLGYLYDERLPLDLESLCLRFGIDSVFKEEYGKSVTEIDGARLIERNTRDARNTILLRDVLWPKLTNSEQKVYKEVLLPAAKSLAQIELNGMCYSPDRIKSLVKDLNKRLLDMDLENEPAIKEFTANASKPFNPGSADHKKMVIFEMLGYEPLPFRQAYTDTGAPSTKADVLRAMLRAEPNETLEKIIKAASYVRWKGTYEDLDAHCDGCGRPHTLELEGNHYVFSSLGFPETSTGRVKTSHPNQQNKPIRNGGEWTRRVFIPRTGVDKGAILEADYSQIELRLIAGVSEDERLIEDFLSGKDPHEEMARIAFGITGKVSKEDRGRGKTLNFVLPFGGGAERIAFDTGRTIPEAKIFMKKYWREHPQLKNFLDNIPKRGIITSCSGMKRHCSTWMQGKNFHTQNPALVALLVALNKIVPVMQERAPVMMVIHDSILFDVADKKDAPEIIEEVRELMEFEAYELYAKLPLPLVVDFKLGDSWGEMVDYE